MIEVEAKIRIKDVQDIRKKVEKIAKYSGKEIKIDDYYALGNLKKYPKKSIRIRKKNDQYEVNIKKKISYIKGVHAKKEVELSSTHRDLNIFLEIIKDFGFKHWLRKEKETELYEVDKGFHIEINNVKGLGYFIEVEYLCEESEVEKARKRVSEVLKKLEINEKDIIKSGYTKMLWDLKH